MTRWRKQGRLTTGDRRRTVSSGNASIHRNLIIPHYKPFHTVDPHSRCSVKACGPDQRAGRSKLSGYVPESTKKTENFGTGSPHKPEQQWLLPVPPWCVEEGQIKCLSGHETGFVGLLSRAWRVSHFVRLFFFSKRATVSVGEWVLARCIEVCLSAAFFCRVSVQ